MKKVLIFYASYGGGHQYAAKSIYECIETNYPEIQIELIDCMKYVNKTVEKLSTAAYREAAKKAPWVWGRIYNDSQKGPLAHLSSRSNKIMAIKLMRLLREKNPDLIISTHPFSSQMCTYLKRKKKINAQIATILTDFAPHDQWLIGKENTDFYFVSTNKMKDALVAKNIPESRVFITGMPISSRFLQNFDKSKILNELGFDINRKTILFFGGGEFGLGKSKTVEIFRAMVENFNNLQIIAIAGKNPKMKACFEEVVSECGKENYVNVLEYTNKVPEFMSVSDLVVTKPGGLTTTESLVCNLPMVIINPIPGQEEENAEFLENEGIAVWIRKKDDPKIVLENLLNDENKLKLMKENTKKISNRNSTNNICSILLKNTSI